MLYKATSLTSGQPQLTINLARLDQATESAYPSHIFIYEMDDVPVATGVKPSMKWDEFEI